jgi:hypothetical protein
VTEFPDYLPDEVAASVSWDTAEDSVRTVMHRRERGRPRRDCPAHPGGGAGRGRVPRHDRWGGGPVMPPRTTSPAMAMLVSEARGSSWTPEAVEVIDGPAGRPVRGQATPVSRG